MEGRQKRDKDLAALIHLALNLKKGDLEAVRRDSRS